MEKADSCRRAAVGAVADVEPPKLHDYIESVLERASMVPGTLTLESATAMAADGYTLEGDLPLSGIPEVDRDRAHEHEYDSNRDAGCDPDGIVTHAAGVQLIYEGLRLTRTLAHDEPWTAINEAGDSNKKQRQQR
ncbi:hypothetical protein HYG82_21195 [Natrinema halophilum]|nr:hypothetical protein [Natrinema halophilum]UHQ95994.1 hypothetical protein HYG82_21195 [Natrinema halophilum]